MPFGYLIREAGNGWKDGTVILGFVNTTDQPLDPQKVSFQVLEATVETEEGKTYPASLYFAECPERCNVPWKPTTEIKIAWGKQLPLPSRLPVSMIWVVEPKSPGSRGVQAVYNIVNFRFAQAAHPTRLVLRSPDTTFTIDLSSGMAIPTPAPLVGFSSKSLDDLATALNQRNSKIQVTFGKCFLLGEKYGGAAINYALPYTVTNTNQLDEEKVEAPFGVWYPSGVYQIDAWTHYRADSTAHTVLRIQAGPGQTIAQELWMYKGTLGGDPTPTYLVEYSPDQTQVQLYELGCPHVNAK